LARSFLVLFRCSVSQKNDFLPAPKILSINPRATSTSAPANSTANNLSAHNSQLTTIKNKSNCNNETEITMARPRGTKKYGKAKEPAGGWLTASPHTKHGQKLVDLIQMGEVTNVSRNICRQACFDCSSNIRLSFRKQPLKSGINTLYFEVSSQLQCPTSSRSATVWRV
jgi:hypothetical protein